MIFPRSEHVCDNQVNRTVKVVHDCVALIKAIHEVDLPVQDKLANLLIHTSTLYTMIVFSRLLGVRGPMMNHMKSYCPTTYEYLEMAIPQFDAIYDREMTREMAGPVEDLVDATKYMVEAMAKWKNHPEH